MVETHHPRSIAPSVSSLATSVRLQHPRSTPPEYRIRNSRKDPSFLSSLRACGSLRLIGSARAREAPHTQSRGTPLGPLDPSFHMPESSVGDPQCSCLFAWTRRG